MQSDELFLTNERTAFPGLLRSFRLRSGYSQNELARRARIDPAYVNRMEAASGESPVVPRRRIIEAIAVALRLDDAEMDGLLVAAGYCPRAVLEVGAWDRALATVAEVLSDPNLSGQDRQEFRELIRLVAARWRRPASVDPRRK